VRISTPLGEYPFEFRGIERRKTGVAIVGTVAGLESSVLLDGSDLKAAAKRVAPPAAAIFVLFYIRSRA
jgi:hypothetical protein